MTFCSKCKSLMTFVDGKRICKRCNVSSNKKNTKSQKNEKKEKKSKESSSAPYVISSWQGYSIVYIDLEEDVKFFDDCVDETIRNYAKTFCKGPQAKVCYISLDRFKEFKSELETRIQRNKVPCSSTTCRTCTFELEDPETLGAKLLEYRKRTLKEMNDPLKDKSFFLKGRYEFIFTKRASEIIDCCGRDLSQYTRMVCSNKQVAYVELEYLVNNFTTFIEIPNKGISCNNQECEKQTCTFAIDNPELFEKQRKDYLGAGFKSNKKKKRRTTKFDSK